MIYPKMKAITGGDSWSGILALIKKPSPETCPLVGNTRVEPKAFYETEQGTPRRSINHIQFISLAMHLPINLQNIESVSRN